MGLYERCPNLVLYSNNGTYRLFIFLRNPAFRTPRSLRHIKREGVGVIEAAGEAILPVPSCAGTWRLIREQGLELVKKIIAANSAVAQGRQKLAEELIKSAGGLAE